MDFNGSVSDIRTFWTKPPAGPRRVRCSCHARRLTSQEQMFVITYRGGFFGTLKRLIFCAKGAAALGDNTRVPTRVEEYPGT